MGTSNIGPFPSMLLLGGMQVLIWPIDPVTGFFVPGVIVQDIAIHGETVGADDTTGTSTVVMPVFPYGANV